MNRTRRRTSRPALCTLAGLILLVWAAGDRSLVSAPAGPAESDRGLATISVHIVGRHWPDALPIVSALQEWTSKRGEFPLAWTDATRIHAWRFAAPGPIIVHEYAALTVASLSLPHSLTGVSPSELLKMTVAGSQTMDYLVRDGGGVVLMASGLPGATFLVWFAPDSASPSTPAERDAVAIVSAIQSALSLQ